MVLRTSHTAMLSHAPKLTQANSFTIPDYPVEADDADAQADTDAEHDNPLCTSWPSAAAQSTPIAIPVTGAGVGMDAGSGGASATSATTAPASRPCTVDKSLLPFTGPLSVSKRLEFRKKLGLRVDTSKETLARASEGTKPPCTGGLLRVFVSVAHCARETFCVCICAATPSLKPSRSGRFFSAVKDGCVGWPGVYVWVVVL